MRCGPRTESSAKESREAQIETYPEERELEDGEQRARQTVAKEVAQRPKNLRESKTQLDKEQVE
jgi:hypothetical protein